MTSIRRPYSIWEDEGEEEILECIMYNLLTILDF